MIVFAMATTQLKSIRVFPITRPAASGVWHACGTIGVGITMLEIVDTTWDNFSEFYINANRASDGFDIGELEFNVVPIPPALFLFGTALGGLGWLGRRRRREVAA